MHLVNGISLKWLLSSRVKRKSPDQAEALCLLLLVLSEVFISMVACAVAIPLPVALGSVSQQLIHMSLYL